MSQPGDDRNDLEANLRRSEQEFGPRRPPDEFGPGQPPSVNRTPLGQRVNSSLIILGAISLIYLLSLVLSGRLFQPSLEVLILLGAKENSLIDQGQYWRLISATFLHANLIHIFFNGYALYALGPESERIYGTGRFLGLYLLAGLGGSVASYLLSPAPSVGASGAIFGLIGALGGFYFLNRKVLGDFGRAQVQNMVAIVMINLLIGFSAAGVIDNWGHIGGLLTGLAAGAALAPRLSLDQRFFPPIPRRTYLPQGAILAGLLGLGLLGLAVILPGA